MPRIGDSHFTGFQCLNIVTMSIILWFLIILLVR
jgi:hypothetical protein